MATKNNDNNNFNYIKYNEHRRLLRQIDHRIIDACKNDTLLINIVPMLSACSNDIQFNHMIRDNLKCRSDRHTISITLQSFDRRIYNVFVKNENNNLVSLRLLKTSIERDISIECQIRHSQQQQQTGTRLRKLFRKLQWKRVWKRYRLRIVGDHDDNNHIDFTQNNLNGCIEILNNCCMEFIAK